MKNVMCTEGRQKCQKQENTPKRRAAGSRLTQQKGTWNGQEDKNSEAEKNPKTGILETE